MIVGLLLYGTAVALLLAFGGLVMEQLAARLGWPRRGVWAVTLIMSITVPIAWFPRLAHGSRAERAKWRLIGKGSGVHWPDLDEDISVERLLAGRMSEESPESLEHWLEDRKHGKS